jgi:hypothetical protein
MELGNHYGGITQPPAPANEFNANFQSLSVAQEECDDLAGNLNLLSQDNKDKKIKG